MITVTARINISGNSGKISSIPTHNFVGNNASSDIGSVLERRNTSTVRKPFILGGTRLGSGGKFVGTVPYFVSRQLSDSNGIFQSSYTLTIKGYDIKSAIIVFDKQNNAHPNSIVVDGKTYIDDDAQFELIFDNASDTHTITISNWNRPHSSLIITSIYADIDIEIDNRNLLSFYGNILDRENIEEPSYGIVCNSGSLTFIDYNEQVLDLITQKILHSGLSVSISLNNTSTNSKEDICVMNINNLSYDNDNKQVSVDIKDSLEQWQDVVVDSIDYDFADTTSKPFSLLYNYLRGYAINNGFNMLSLEQLDSDTRNIIENTTIQYYFFEGGTLWNSFYKFCEALQLHIYINDDGIVVCRK